MRNREILIYDICRCLYSTAFYRRLRYAARQSIIVLTHRRRFSSGNFPCFSLVGTTDIFHKMNSLGIRQIGQQAFPIFYSRENRDIFQIQCIPRGSRVNSPGWWLTFPEVAISNLLVLVPGVGVQNRFSRTIGKRTHSDYLKSPKMVSSKELVETKRWTKNVLLRSGDSTNWDLRNPMMLSKKNEHVGLAWGKNWREDVGRCPCFVKPTSLKNAYDADDAAQGTSTHSHNRCIKEGDQMTISGLARCGYYCLLAQCARMS